LAAAEGGACRRRLNAYAAIIDMAASLARG
jgi:hypothetical protein